jgi:hypothetical protein
VAANRILLADEQALSPWKIDEPMLLPATVQEFVDRDHLARLVLHLVVEAIDLEAIERVYRVDRGHPREGGCILTFRTDSLFRSHDFIHILNFRAVATH